MRKEHNCFAFIEGERGRRKPESCTALECSCTCAEACPFFRTKRAARQSLDAAYRRIASLPLYRQVQISLMYYGGTMPWDNPTEEEDSVCVIGKA